MNECSFVIQAGYSYLSSVESEQNKIIVCQVQLIIVPWIIMTDIYVGNIAYQLQDIVYYSNPINVISKHCIRFKKLATHSFLPRIM